MLVLAVSPKVEERGKEHFLFSKFCGDTEDVADLGFVTDFFFFCSNSDKISCEEFANFELLVLGLDEKVDFLNERSGLLVI